MRVGSRRSHQAPFAALVILFLFNCNGESPTSPSKPVPPVESATGLLWGFVHDESGVCIRGALVEVMDGPRAGAQMTQVGDCNVWSYSDGYSFNDLPLNRNVRLRASKAGYRSREATFFVTANATQQSSILLVPE